jgi:hypothetical protein
VPEPLELSRDRRTEPAEPDHHDLLPRHRCAA